MLDIHAHLSDKRLIDSAADIVQRAKDGGIEIIVDSGYDITSSKSAVKLAEAIKGVFATVGIHPEKPWEYSDAIEQELINLSNSKKVIAIGEVGLDYHYEGFNKNLQRDVFYRQIVLSDSLKLPLVIHSRDALLDTLDVLDAAKNYLNHGILMHCYAESAEMVNSFLNYNAYFSLGGVITFKNSRKGEVAKAIPIDRILAETDSPYLTPEPFRGKTNSPENVYLVYRRLAEFYGVEVEIIEKAIRDNAFRLFEKLF